jgi:hypothetical protein
MTSVWAGCAHGVGACWGGTSSLPGLRVYSILLTLPLLPRTWISQYLALNWIIKKLNGSYIFHLKSKNFCIYSSLV